MKTDFVTELLEAMPTPQSQLILAARLAKYAGQMVYIPVEPEAPRRIRAAQHMLSNGMGSSDVARALVERFRVSGRTAQRDVSEARKKA